MPTFTPQEIAQLTKEQAKAASAAETFTQAVAAQQARAVELSVVDGAFKKMFDYYDTDIIGKYDLEQRWINGRLITNPVTESDIISCASLAGGRLQPTLPVTDIIRITQFDGTPNTTDANNELQHITNQSQAETTLVSGYGGSAPAASVLTNSIITPSSTTLQLSDSGSSYSIAPNSVFVIVDGGDLAVVKILTFTMQVSPSPPPYIANCNIEVLVPPSGSIAVGQQLSVFSGFSNSERTTKTAASPQLQPLMDYLVSDLQSKINSRITTLNNQLSAISTNLDPEPGTELTTATTNVNASKTFLNNYLITTDVSNTGLSSLSSERGTRSSQASARVSQITSAYTGRTKNYYDERYNSANNRANTSRGTLRQQKNAEQVAVQSQTYATSLTDQANAIQDLLS